jgi:hypothetical protein
MPMINLKKKVAKTIIRVLIVSILFLYPGVFCLKVVFDSSLRKGDIPEFSVEHFRLVSLRFKKWAGHYIESQRATKVHHENCAATEWPMFGSVYYLLTAEEMQKHLINRKDKQAQNTLKILREAAEEAAKIVADPKTGTWVEIKWGPDYLYKENAFYRMLLIMGLSSYENITQDKKYHTILKEQSVSLSDELMSAPYHMLDDYPGESYPNDVLWATAAIVRANRLIGVGQSSLKDDVLGVLDTRSLTRERIPAYAIDSRSGLPVSPARGCANSGILVFVPELDLKIASKWYGQHEKFFLQDNGFCMGFREYTRDYRKGSMDVDTGPIVGGIGSAASVFGIGAARALGRLDHAVPMTMEIIALSWPSPFGYIIPSMLSYSGAGTSCLGEVAMLFLTTRPILTKDITPYTGIVPGIIWVACIFYLGIGIAVIFEEYFSWKKFLSEKSSK